METKSSKKVANFFNCIFCDYLTDRKCNYDKHILTAKHQKKAVGNLLETKSSNTENLFFCSICGQTYLNKSGLWKHKSRCKKVANKDSDLLMSKLIDQNIKLITQNHEFKQLITEQMSEQTNVIAKLAENNKSIITNSIINSHNNFNINVFLNEKCKDALNITDFINSLVVSIKDLEDTARLGYADGISKIFIDGLKQLDIYKRPLHCSDLKREVLYIKDENKWSKEDNEKGILTKAIKNIANKNIKNLPEWTQKNPEFMDPESKQNDKYIKIVSESMPGSTKEESCKNHDKIIKNIVKEVVIDK